MRHYMPILVYGHDGDIRADMVEVEPYNGLYCLKSEADTIANDQSLLSMTLLVHYQEWSGATVTNAGQAFDIVAILRRALWSTTKKVAADLLARSGYDSTTKRSKVLVDSIWDLKKIYRLQMPNDQADRRGAIGGVVRSAGQSSDSVGTIKQKERHDDIQDR